MLRRGACIGVVLAALLLVFETHSSAQTRPDDPNQEASAGLSLRSQTVWWQPGSSFTIAIGLSPSTPSDAEVSVGLFSAVPTRSQFAKTVQGQLARRPVVEIPRVKAGDLPVDERGDRVVTITPPFTKDGVYPVR